jgi:esterase/lipase superfamily enzyme
MSKVYVVSNREFFKNASYEKVFSDNHFSDGPRGPNELHLVSIGNGDKEVKELSSKDCFVEIQSRMESEGKNALLYVHGFNNKWKAVYNRLRQLEDLYGVIPIAFAWPSGMEGIPLNDYREKKRFAMLSSEALDRTLEKLNECFEKSEKHCGQTINLLMHSMGNYLFKGLFTQGHYSGETRIFDNVIMAAADVNNRDHKDFVNKIQCRGNVYITINKDDFALGISSTKLGKKQKARLGETRRHLDADAIYVDFSKSKGTNFGNNSHTYFLGEPVKGNVNIERFFEGVFNGRDAEEDMDLKYDSKRNTYKID